MHTRATTRRMRMSGGSSRIPHSDPSTSMHVPPDRGMPDDHQGSEPQMKPSSSFSFSVSLRGQASSRRASRYRATPSSAAHAVAAERRTASYSLQVEGDRRTRV